MPRTRQYLFIYDGLKVVDTEANLGTGKTITAYLSLSAKGNGAAISATTKTATGSGGSYTITYTRAELQTALASMINQTVYLHLDDGVAAHEIYVYTVTDQDPDTLPSIIG
jgi:hypothetical protein